MSTPDPRTYEEFWPHYVRAHRKPETRLFHAVGTAAFLTCVAAFVATRRKSLLLAMPVVGYGPAWYSHFFVEGNKPATFGHPLWSLRGDFEMLIRMATGTMDSELERWAREEPEAAAAPAPEAPAPAPSNGHSNGHGAHDAPAATPDRPLN